MSIAGTAVRPHGAASLAALAAAANAVSWFRRPLLPLTVGAACAAPLPIWSGLVSASVAERSFHVVSLPALLVATTATPVAAGSALCVLMAARMLCIPICAALVGLLATVLARRAGFSSCGVVAAAAVAVLPPALAMLAAATTAHMVVGVRGATSGGSRLPEGAAVGLSRRRVRAAAPPSTARGALIVAAVGGRP